jgi:AraC-like DNA-binding protein
MFFLTFYKEGELMLESYFSNASSFITYYHKKNIKSGNWDYHLHDSYEIYFLLEGTINYFIGKTIYTLKPGDLIVINSNEIHTHSLQSNDNYDRILIMFDPKVLRLLNSPDFNLLSCFENRNNGERNKLTLRRTQVEELLNITNRMDTVNSDDFPGNKLLKLSYFIELLVFINKAFLENSETSEDTVRNEKLLPVLNYIEDNIDVDLSLEAIEKKFFINRYYLSRIFKASVGISIHKYIILKRIVKAKTLLAQGYDVTDTCYRCGFKDYSNFLKMFKSIVGVSPAKYRVSNNS